MLHIALTIIGLYHGVAVSLPDCDHLHIRVLLLEGRQH
jgi:hypothetical protein